MKYVLSADNYYDIEIGKKVAAIRMRGVNDDVSPPEFSNTIALDVPLDDQGYASASNWGKALDNLALRMHEESAP